MLERLLYEAPQQMINFKVYKRGGQEERVAGMDRRLTRIKNQNHLPLGVWAKWIVESIPTSPLPPSFLSSHVTCHVMCCFRDDDIGNMFQKFLMALIIINSISIGVQGGRYVISLPSPTPPPPPTFTPPPSSPAPPHSPLSRPSRATSIRSSRDGGVTRMSLFHRCIHSHCILSGDSSQVD